MTMIFLSVLGLLFLLRRFSSEQMVNIALKKIPTQSGTLSYPESGGPFFWNVSNSVDGWTECRTPDYQTYSGTAELDNPWWQLDLGSVYTIYAIHVLGQLDVNNQLTGFRLWTGPEENSLSIVYRNTISDYNNGNIWINNSMTVRVIKIDLPKDNVPIRVATGPLVLCEVEVYIRVNGDIKQSSIVSMTKNVYQRYGASFAIDGKYPRVRTESPEACNCCSIAAGYVIPWWTIDFGQVRMIGGINITGRGDSNLQQSKNLMILISNTSLTLASWLSTEPVWTIDKGAQGYFFLHVFKQPRLFRYLTITSLNQTRQVMTICEVDFIITACRPGSYGDTCSGTCGHCNGSTHTCVNVNGTCQSGCLPGFDYIKDRTCKTACQTGRFGINCNETCGYCFHGSECNIFDGTCSAGCALGYNYDEDRTCKTASPFPTRNLLTPSLCGICWDKKHSKKNSVSA